MFNTKKKYAELAEIAQLQDITLSMANDVIESIGKKNDILESKKKELEKQYLNSVDSNVKLLKENIELNSSKALLKAFNYGYVKEIHSLEDKNMALVKQIAELKEEVKSMLDLHNTTARLFHEYRVKVEGEDENTIESTDKAD